MSIICNIFTWSQKKRILLVKKNKNLNKAVKQETLSHTLWLGFAQLLIMEDPNQILVPVGNI